MTIDAGIKKTFVTTERDDWNCSRSKKNESRFWLGVRGKTLPYNQLNLVLHEVQYQ